MNAWYDDIFLWLLDGFEYVGDIMGKLSAIAMSPFVDVLNFFKGEGNFLSVFNFFTGKGYPWSFSFDLNNSITDFISELLVKLVISPDMPFVFALLEIVVSIVLIGAVIKGLFNLL